MSTPRSTKHSSLGSNAEKLRDLLNAHEATTKPGHSTKHIYQELPQLDDLVRLIQTVENVNQQLLFENKYLKDEMVNAKASLLKLIEENNNLHKELKNITVLEILAELQNQPQKLADNNQSVNADNQSLQNELKNKYEELQQNQLLINELQKKLQSQEFNKNTIKNNKRSNNGTSAANLLADTLDQIDSYPICCTKCTEELEIKIRQIENLKNDLEQMSKSKDFLKNKIDDMEIKEADLIAQIKKHYELINLLEMEKSQALIEKEQFKVDKENSDKNFQTILNELNEKIFKEKEAVIKNIEGELGSISEQNKTLEERLSKQENLIDRLTRDKISLISELDSYKKKCNSFDLETHQMSEKLKNKYMDALKERDTISHELKRVRHDYDLYVKENDQTTFCLRSELNKNRERLMDAEKELILSKEECLKLNETINKLEADLLLSKHSKESIENSRNENLKELEEKFDKRESQLIMGIEALQARYCVTVKDLEDVVEMQRKLLTKLKEECKILNEQLELLAIKYKNDTQYLNNQQEELTTRLSKYEKRVIEFEEQSEKHNRLHDKMKERLKEMTSKLEEYHEMLRKSETNESLMKTTNIQLMQEISLLKRYADVPLQQKKQQQIIEAKMRNDDINASLMKLSEASKNSNQNMAKIFNGLDPIASVRSSAF